ncbi:transposase [Paenibacillus sp. GCM10023252]|uniref:transposase n=1 Tax=Paenibacillus sp. GCM10023252 TaxID=3252649 RepID=UPI00360CC4BE
MSDDQHKMQPMSGEPVEVEGVYKDEWGHEMKLNRGRTFPADEQLGTTEWELIEYDINNHHDGETDPRLVKDDGNHKIRPISKPKRHE